MSARPLTATIRQLGDLADVRGASLEASAWRRLLEDVEHGGDAETARLTELARRNRMSDAARVDPSLHAPLRELLLDGPEALLSAVVAGLPWVIRALLDLPSIDSDGAAALARAGVVTLSDLEAALEDGRIATHLPSHVDRLRTAAETLKPARPVTPIGRALDISDALVQLIGVACPSVEHLTAAGGVRRCEPLVDIVVLAGSAVQPVDALAAIAELPQLRVLHRSARRVLTRYNQTEVDIRIAAPDELGTILFLATGPVEHLAQMRARQRAARIASREEDVYSQAGLAWIPAEMRQGTGEIEAAAAGTLPALVARGHIRGDLHMHSIYSDGYDSLADMVHAAHALGYEYIAITDHSERAAASRTLSRRALAQQREEIARLREHYAPMTILHGIEVDIMPDGRLDFPDEILETLDIVLASLHDRAGHDPAQLTRRCLQAIAHPLVNVITHPANRLVGRDGGYALDFPAVYAAAAASGTALEIDGAPSHLDLDGEHAREAVAAGVTVTIDSDCHRARLLDKQMRLGVGTARRGWVEPKHVLNTRPLDEVRAFVAAKRQARR